MIKQSLIVLAAIGSFLIIVCQAKPMDTDFDYVSGYNKLNEHLIKTVPTDDLDENLAEIMKERNRLSEDDDKNYRFAVAEMSNARKAVVKEADSDVDVDVDVDVDEDEDEGEDKMCDRFDIDLLIDSAIHTNAHGYFADPTKELNRIQLIVYKLGLKHAERCKNVWPEIFRIVFPLMSEHILYSFVEGWQKEILSKKPSMSNREYMEWLIDLEPLSSDHYDHYVAHAAEHIKKQQASENAISEGGDFEAMYEEYLHEPCSQYTTSPGEDLLQQASFDAHMYPGHDGYVLGGDEENLLNFYKAMAYDKNCAKVVGNQKFKDDVIEKLIGQSQ